MTIRYRIDSVRKVVFTTFDGEVNDEEIVRHATDIESDLQIDGSFVELIQATTTSMKNVTFAGARAVAETITGSSSIDRIGIVASRDVEFGLARMVEMLADEAPVKIKVFRDETAARAWLGLE